MMAGAEESDGGELSADAQEQQDEMTALDNILNDECGTEAGNDSSRRRFSHSVVAETGGLVGGRMDAVVAQTQQGRIRVRYALLKGDKEEPLRESFVVSHLPPIRLNFCLPKDYPSKSRPRFHLSCPWLGKERLEAVGKHLEALWEENAGCVVLYTWLSALQEEVADLLGLCGDNVAEEEEDKVDLDVDISQPVKAELGRKVKLW